MSANLESLAYVSNEENGRFVPWHGLGTPVEKAMTSEEALELAGLNWEVKAEPVYANGLLIPDYKANIRQSDGTFLGMVGNRYQIIQNREAFDFTDSLVGEGCVYETAGSLDGGKRVFLLARLPEEKILGDEVCPYIAFTNGFNGYYSVKACITPVRVVCQNTLNLALDNASKVWTTKHTGNINSKLETAKETLGLAKDYMKKLDQTANVLAETKISDSEVEEVLNKIYPVAEDATDRMKQNVQDIKDGFYMCMISPDILKFRNTAWGVVQAASDFTTHTKPKNVRSNYEEKNFGKVLDGNIVLDKIFEQMLMKASI